MTILGSQIRKLYLGQDSAQLNVDVMLSKCCNIEDLRLKEINPKAYFGTPRHELKYLHLDCENMPDQDIIGIAKNCGRLQKMCHEGARIPRHVLGHIARSNKCVESVAFLLVISDSDAIEDIYSAYMADIIDSFLDCQQLKSASINSECLYLDDDVFDDEDTPVTTIPKIPAIIEQCLVLRHRNVTVRMDDLHQHPPGGSRVIMLDLIDLKAFPNRGAVSSQTVLSAGRFSSWWEFTPFQIFHF